MVFPNPGLRLSASLLVLLIFGGILLAIAPSTRPAQESGAKFAAASLASEQGEQSRLSPAHARAALPASKVPGPREKLVSNYREPSGWSPARSHESETPETAKAPDTHSSAEPLPPGTILHVVKRGEGLSSLIHLYLSSSDWMTATEMDAALRHANGERKGNGLKPGESILVPGMPATPILERPVGVPRDFEARGIYLTGGMAGSDRGIALIRRWREAGGNAVVFDIKDSDGSLSVSFEHPLAAKIRRAPIQNLPKFIHFLHVQGMHAIARIAIFRDEGLVLSHPETAARSRRSGAPWRENRKLVWTDPSRDDVQNYNIALAAFVARSGADEIQFDYVRFPAEGDQADASFVFQSQHPQWQRPDVIADFLSRAYSELHSIGALLSLDVFGVMAWQRSIDLAHTGQDIARMARFCDVLSPMIYPSHFFGMDGYDHPGDAPEHFIGESMERFRQVTAGSTTTLRPWLQAFAWRTKTYSPDYILKQVVTAKSNGGIGFLFWNARNDYGKPFVAMAAMRAAPERFFGRAKEKEDKEKAVPASSRLHEPANAVPHAPRSLHPN